MKIHLLERLDPSLDSWVRSDGCNHHVSCWKTPIEKQTGWTKGNYYFWFEKWCLFLKKQFETEKQLRRVLFMVVMRCCWSTKQIFAFQAEEFLFEIWIHRVYGTVDNSSQKIINGNKLGPLNVVALSKQKGGTTTTFSITSKWLKPF